MHCVPSQTSTLDKSIMITAKSNFRPNDRNSDSTKKEPPPFLPGRAFPGGVQKINRPAHRNRQQLPVAESNPTLALPPHDRNGTDRIRRGTIDYLSTDSEVDDRISRFIHHTIDASGLEENARFLTKHLFIFS
jgi:hypothetical protein